jgi:hypothetical protein
MTRRLTLSTMRCFVSPPNSASGPGVFQLLLRIGFLWLLLPGFPAVAQAKSSATSTVKSDSQAVGKKEFDAAKELDRMTKRYNLTQEQREKIQPILAAQQMQVHQLGEDESLSEAAWAAAVQEVHQQTVSKIKPLMADTQLSKFMKDEAKRTKQSLSDQGDDGFDGPPGGFPPGGPGGGGPPGE